MGITRGSMTRREILKRGAIVGGGVLWVAPVVQTLGMGPAYAAPVSGPAGADPCAMELVLDRCSVHPAGAGLYIARFLVRIPSGCACSVLDSGHGMWIVMDRSYANPMYLEGGVGDRYTAQPNIKVDSVARVVCGAGPFDRNPVGEGAPFTFTAEIAKGCTRPNL